MMSHLVRRSLRFGSNRMKNIYECVETPSHLANMGFVASSLPFQAHAS